MRLLWLAPTSMNLEPIIESVPYIHVHWYDRHDRPDIPIMDAVETTKPDVIVYIGTAGGPHCPVQETFRYLNAKTPVILLCGDASDAGWTPYLEEYNRETCFTRIVNFDGNDDWPSGPNDLTTLTPIAEKFYAIPPPLWSRPYAIGFAGGYQGGFRAEVVETLRPLGLMVHPRNEQYGSYREYADFLQQCRIVVNMSASASGNSRQVKGRVLEAAYAGAVLLEQSPSATEDWFIKEKDYAGFVDSMDVTKLARLLLASENRMNDLSINLHEHVQREYSAARIWTQILDGIL